MNVIFGVKRVELSDNWSVSGWEEKVPFSKQEGPLLYSRRVGNKEQPRSVIEKVIKNHNKGESPSLSSLGDVSGGS